MILCLVIQISSVHMAMRSERNNFKHCISNNNCYECKEENNYKKCENNKCYCCDFVLRKCNYQNLQQ